MVERSIVVLEDGRMTGSRMRVYMRGSEDEEGRGKTRQFEGRRTRGHQTGERRLTQVVVRDLERKGKKEESVSKTKSKEGERNEKKKRNARLTSSPSSSASIFALVSSTLSQNSTIC